MDARLDADVSKVVSAARDIVARFEVLGEVLNWSTYVGSVDT